MKKMFISLAFVCVSQICLAQDAYKQDALKLIELSGGSSAQLSMIKEQILPMIAEDKQEAFMKDIKASLPSLNNKIADFYMQKLSHAEVKEVLKFYSSPVGKKMASVSEEIAVKSLEYGQEWAVELQGILMKYMEQ